MIDLTRFSQKTHQTSTIENDGTKRDLENMQDIIERVARAISRRFIQANKDAGHPTNLTWKDYRADAIAAIEAMREPTDVMLDAGFHRADAVGFLSDNDDVAKVYSAILDAALAGEKQ